MIRSASIGLAALEDGPDRSFGRCVPLDPLQAGFENEADAPLLELSGDEGGHIVVQAKEGPFPLFDDDDFGAERAENEGHLAADDAGPDDEQAPGDGVHGRELVGGEDDFSVERQIGQGHGPGSRGDDRPGRVDDRRRTVGKQDLEHTRSLERGRAGQGGDGVLAEKRRQDAELAQRRLMAAVEDRLVVGPGVLDDGNAVALALLEVLQEVGGIAEDLAGQGPGPDTAAAELGLAVDHADLGPELGGPEGGRNAGLAAADDDDVVVAHDVLVFRASGASIRRRRYRRTGAAAPRR